MASRISAVLLLGVLAEVDDSCLRDRGWLPMLSTALLLEGYAGVNGKGLMGGRQLRMLPVVLPPKTFAKVADMCLFAPLSFIA